MAKYRKNTDIVNFEDVEMPHKDLTFEEQTNEPADQEKIEYELRDMGGGFVERIRVDNGASGMSDQG